MAICRVYCRQGRSKIALSSSNPQKGIMFWCHFILYEKQNLKKKVDVEMDLPILIMKNKTKIHLTHSKHFNCAIPNRFN